MSRLLLTFLLLAFLNFEALANIQNLAFKQEVLNFNDQYFNRDDIKVLKIERHYTSYQGGLGPERRYGSYVLTLKVRNLNYDKGFEINNRFSLVIKKSYVGKMEDFDIWKLEIENNNFSAFDLNVFMPASFWSGTPTYGTRQSPGYIGPSFNVRILL